MKAVVIGGGFAGLAAGYRLKKAGWDVTLLEQNAEVGGRVNTTRQGGYLTENGATQISTGYQAYLALAADVGLRSEIIECTNVIGLLRNGKVYEIDGTRPILAAFSGALSLASKFRMGRAIADLLRLKPAMNVLDVSAHHAYDIESAKDYCDRRLTREIYDVLVDASLRCYVLNRAEHVSVIEWYSFLRNLAGQKMLTMRGGLQRFPIAIAATLDVRFNSPATQVRSYGRGVVVEYIDAGGKPFTLQADACVIATLLPDVAALAPSLAYAVAPLAQRLTYNRAAVVHLGYRKRTTSKAIGVLVGTAEHAQIGLLWLEHNKLAESAPEGHSLFSVYFETAGLDSIAPVDDERLIVIGRQFVEKLFAEVAGCLDLQRVTRWQRAIANPAPGVYRAVHEMKSRLDPTSRIQLAGDYLTCTGQNSAAHWGAIAADNLIGAVTKGGSGGALAA